MPSEVGVARCTGNPPARRIRSRHAANSLHATARRALGRDRSGLELVSARRVHGGRRLVAAHRRDLRAGAHRRGSRGERQAGGGADAPRAGDARRVRPLLPGGGRPGSDGRGGRGRHQRDPRRRERRGFPGAGARAHEPADPRAQPRGGGALRLSRGGQLDDPDRRLRAGSRRRVVAAGARRRPARARARLLAPGRGAHDRAVPARRTAPRSDEADRRAARARRARAASRPTGWLRTPAGAWWASAGRFATSPPPSSARSGLPSNGVQAMVVSSRRAGRARGAARGAAGVPSAARCRASSRRAPI